MTKKNDKKKGSLLKKIIAGTGITFVLVLIAAVLVPVFFKDQLKELALNEANKILKSDVAVGDFDLTIFSTFPKLKLVFDDVTITGRDQFEGIELVNLKTLEAKLDFWSVINMDNIAIRSVKLINPNVHVRILENGDANYDIVKTNEELAAEDIDTTATPFKLSLKYYEIQDANILYEDLDSISPMEIEVHHLIHSGNGDLTSDNIHFKTKSTLQKVGFKMGDDLNLNGEDLELDGTIDIKGETTDFDATTLLGDLSLKMGNQTVTLQQLDFNGKGKIEKEQIDLKSITSLNELSYKMGGIPYLTKVKTNLDLDLLIDFLKDGYKFTLKENKLNLNALALSFDGFYELLDSHSNIDLKLKAGDIKFKNLLSLIPAFYHTGYESMIADGSMALSGFVKGKLDDTNYPAWNFDASVKNATINYPEMAENIENINITANTNFVGGSDLDKLVVDVSDLNAVFAQNKINGDFHLKYPMSDPLIKTTLNANVDLSTLDKVYPMEEKYQGKVVSDVNLEGRLSAIENEKYQDFDASGSLKLTDFNYNSESLPDELTISDLLLTFSPAKLKVEDFNAKMGKSTFKANGEVSNYMNYVFKEDEDLKGNLTFYSNYINLDEFLPEEAENSEEKAIESTETTETILVPKNIDFRLNTTIDKLIYEGVEVNNIKGIVTVKDEEVELKDLKMEALEGTVALNGKYNTRNTKEPNIDFGWSLKNLDIKKLSEHFMTIETLAPIAKYVDGKISSDFTMNSKLKPSFEPIFNTLNGNGNLFSSTLDISGFEPLSNLGEKLQIKKLSQQTIKNVKATFEFSEGKVFVKPFNVKLGGMNTEIQGSTSFEQDIDYKLEMMIPKDQIPSQVINAAEQAIASVKKIPGFNMSLKELPNEIPVTALITNTIKNPKVTTNLKEKLMELGGNVKEDIQEFVEEKIEEIKDTIRETIEEKVEEVKETVKEEVEKQKQQIMDAAQKQADKVVAEAQKLANKTRNEANANAQKLIDEAGSNVFKKKAAEVTANQVRDQGEKAAKKIENDAQKEANQIMQKAQEQADKIQ